MLGDKIAGQAKAMVVTHSCAHALRFKLKLDNVIRVQPYSLKSRASKKQPLLSDTLEFICGNILQPAFTCLYAEEGYQDDSQRHRNCPDKRDRRHGRHSDSK